MPDASTPMGRFCRLRRVVSLDRAFILTVLAGRWSSAAGAITLILIAHLLAEEGSYYSFSSLLAFERGFSFDVWQRCRHEYAHFAISTSGGNSGDQVAQARLPSALQKFERRQAQKFGTEDLLLL